MITTPIHATRENELAIWTGTLEVVEASTPEVAVASEEEVEFEEVWVAAYAASDDGRDVNVKKVVLVVGRKRVDTLLGLAS